MIKEKRVNIGEDLKINTLKRISEQGKDSEKSFKHRRFVYK